MTREPLARLLLWHSLGSIVSPDSESIRGASHSLASPVEHLRVDHRRLDVLVAEQLLDGANVVAVFEQMSGKGMAQGVAAGSPLDPYACSVRGLR